MSELRGSPTGTHLRIALVVAQFNEFLTKSMVQHTEEGLTGCGVVRDNIDTYWVPGSFEIPLVAKLVGSTLSYDAVICLGVILQGETHHAKLLADVVAAGIEGAARETGVPTVFGVLSVESVDQALNRIDGHSGNRGRQFAQTAVEMANLVQKMKERGGTWHKLFSKT